MHNLTLKSAFAGVFLLGSMALAQAAGSVNSNHESVSQMRSLTAQVGCDGLVTGWPSGYGNVWGTDMQPQESAILPNGILTLSDFAAHR